MTNFRLFIDDHLNTETVKEGQRFWLSDRGSYEDIIPECRQWFERRPLKAIECSPNPPEIKVGGLLKYSRFLSLDETNVYNQGCVS
jgi:hypothetical protein